MRAPILNNRMRSVSICAERIDKGSCKRKQVDEVVGETVKQQAETLARKRWQLKRSAAKPFLNSSILVSNSSSDRYSRTLR